SKRITVLDRGPELCGLVTFAVQDFDRAELLGKIAGRKINVVPTYRDFAVMDFDEKKVKWAVRASPHYYNTIEEVDQFVKAMKEIVGR
ncbi:MAG: aminotransferase class V-fold PLP-dependent enzyme, partial [Bacteroidota bacterium]